jgi:hypothetical protein
MMVLLEMSVECVAKIAMTALRSASGAMGLLRKITFRRGAFFLQLALHNSLIEKQAEELDPHPLANYRVINRSNRGRMRMIKPWSALATEYSSPKPA